MGQASPLADAGPDGKVLVSEGQAVEAGESLAVSEVMKMETVLRPERDGAVSRSLAGSDGSLGFEAMTLDFA